MKKNTLFTYTLAVIMMVNSAFAGECNSNCKNTCPSQCLTGKTFLLPRDINTNMAMDWTTWHALEKDDYEHKAGARFNVNAFYKNSTNEKKLGQYFGFLVENNNKCEPNRGRDFIGVSANTDADMPFLPASVIHPGTGADVTDETLFPLQEILPFRPQREEYGVKLMYYQSLDKWMDGLHFEVHAPITHVRHEIVDCCRCPVGKEFCCEKKSCKSCCQSDCARKCGPSCQGNCDSCCADYCLDSECCPTDCCDLKCFKVEKRRQIVEGQLVSFSDYLAGCVIQKDTGNNPGAPQYRLCKAKISCCADQITVLGDIRAELGYDFVNYEHANLGLSVMAIFPTSNSPTGEYLFEATGGNGAAWAVGGVLEGSYEYAWSSCVFGIHGAFNYQWVFEREHQRTLGYKFRDGSFADLGHYALGGAQGKIGTFPLANVLTRRVDVEGGSKVDTFVALTCAVRGFTIDLGYNLFYKDQEEICFQSWKNDTYAIAATDYDPITEFDVFSSDAINSGVSRSDSRAIQCIDICPEVAASSSQLTHSIFAGLGYEYDAWNVPFLVGLGGSFEWADRRTAIEGWSLWAKIGFVV